MLNRIKAKLNKVFWRIIPDSQLSESPKVIVDSEFHPFEDKDYTLFSSEITEDFKRQDDYYKHFEKLKVYKGKYKVEPTWLFLISGLRKVVKESIFYEGMLPSILTYLKTLLLRKSTTIDKVVLWDGGVGMNYFHFYTDILSKLWCLESNNFPWEQYSFLISSNLKQRDYWNELAKNPVLQKVNFHFVSNEIIRAKEVVDVRPMRYDKSYWARTRDLVLKHFEIEPVLKKKYFYIGQEHQVGLLRIRRR